MKNFVRIILVVSTSIIATTSLATTVQMYFTADQGIGKPVGVIEITENQYGLLFTPHLTDLTHDVHGFHIHQNPSCNNNGNDAGGHFDPQKTNKHLGPYNDKGHLGDLPALTVNADGTSTLPVLAPRLKRLTAIKNHALMIHAGPDNYSDTPAKLGGGGERMICGILK